MGHVSLIGALNCNIPYAACCGLQKSPYGRGMLRPAEIPYGRGLLRLQKSRTACPAAACGEFLSGVYCNKPRPKPILPAPKKSGTHCNASHSINFIPSIRSDVCMRHNRPADHVVYDHARRCMVKESVWPFWLACARRRRHSSGRPVQ